ncbi:Uncharacterised protein [Yersinia enterocolitica]|uniref:DUF6971 family protein n=1 Tax=Yersinia enterocolitica TaxID=630 RepID=UPI0005DF3C21|nr:hypothetical protein [Yersinia enterocolitica]EKN3412699.1 hypothetical protein [Yersinia enterocolitica]EKN3555575.1 hypothetical protein [Yersinia enterocolitica]EKP3823027.1 hypothetical protein [Yersinia enterocolitica]ELI7988418.1 hypothetical protein [Yersinia enterocolitica]ELI8288434.1 hypothetical protein [Yersinia enterocolitica]
MSIAFRKLDIALSVGGETVVVWGQEMSTKYFTEVVVTSMLNSVGDPSFKSNNILNNLHAAGLNAGDYSSYSQFWAVSNQEAREQAQRDRVEVQKHLERVRDMLATPADIRAEALKKQQTAERMEKMYGRKGAAFGL